MSVTVIIIFVTCIISIPVFNNEKVMDKLIFYPPAVSNHNEYYRFFSCGFIHADFMHLGLNMYSLYLFGQFVENRFLEVFGTTGPMFYLLMYLSALPVCLLPTYLKNKDNSNYRSLGASGAVSAVVFAFIFLDPLRKLGLIFLPPNFMIPGFIFGLLYLIATSYLDKKGGGNINHSAHLWGSLYGIAFLVVFGFVFSDHKLVTEFIGKIQFYLKSL